MKSTLLLVLCVIAVVLSIEHDFKGFDDSILFGINWPGAVEESLVIEGDNGGVDGVNVIPNTSGKEVLKVVTANKEKYECWIPELTDPENSNIDNYEGPSPLNLLKPLISQKICSYRLESYWSYEVCHGRYVRQYHEERDGKQVKTQEYFLGHFGIEKQMRFEEQLKHPQVSKEPPKTIKVDGSNLPYVEISMDDGTLCDLNGKARQTRVLYVCYSHGKHEVYSFKETATCEYEIIILSPLLCAHPQFKPKDVSENIIECRPVDGAPKKPRTLLQQEVENMKANQQSIRLMNDDNDPKDMLAVLKVEKIEKDGETHLKFELRPLIDKEENRIEEVALPKAKSEVKPAVITDDSPVRAFLNGENCLNGGSGWWKYEFCYGKHVMQYHVDRSGEKTTLTLGKFDEEAHLSWIKENKGKAPKSVGQRTSISHFYSGGDICDKTGQPRQTEVKLKCVENSSSPAQVTLYLLEPRTCHYILGVESPLICEILPYADGNGLIKSAKPLLQRQDAVEDAKVEEDAVTEEVLKFVND